MKTLSLIFCVVCMVAATNTYGQHITLKEINEPLTKVFRDLEKLTGYQFFFADSDIKLAKKISIDVKNDDLTDILNICFRNQPLTYSVSGTTVMVKRKDESIKKNESLNTPDIIVNIHGHVTDSLGNSLAGASVLVKGSKNGTTTDAKGDFSLSGSGENESLIISFTGYSSKQIPIIYKNPIVVTLNKSVSPLDEVQVIAYGTVTKALNTGNVSTVKAKDIEMQPVSNPLEALVGRVPGMVVTQQNGLPGSAVKVQIRGQNSITNGNAPLYVIDGVPYSAENYLPSVSGVLGSSSTTSGGGTFGSPFSYINPADIESIDVLKDADATAIYGTRGANGVILITTKKGKEGQTRVAFNIQSGFGKVAETMKLLNTSQYLEMRHEAFKNDGASPNPNADYDLTLWDTTRQTNWQKVLIGNTSRYSDAQATVSGGTTNTQFLIGTGYHRETTVFPGDFSDQSGSVHFNITNTSPNQRFRIQLSGLFLIDNNNLSGNDLTTQALTMTPDAPPLYNPDGSINWATNAAGYSTWPFHNPIAMLLDKYQVHTSNLISNAVLSYKILDGLEILSSFGFTDRQSNQVLSVPLSSYEPALRPYSQRSSNFAFNNYQSWIVEPQLSYTKKLFDGSLSALLGTTIQQNLSNGQVILATGFLSDLVLEDIGAAATITGSTVNDVYKYNALFARLNYNWQDKYLINLTARRDGSSRFGPANQFHNFGAVGAAWIFSKEDIIRQALPFLSFGKLRGSYGTTGSDQVGDYTFMDLYSPVNSPISNVGNPYQGSQGYLPVRIFTPDLSWEETRKLEGAIELGFLQDRIYLSASYYRNRSSNQLVGYLLPSLTGFTSVNRNLPATVQNEGLEFELKTVNIKTRYFSWTSTLNVSLNRNALIAGAPGLSDYYENKIGHSLSSVYVYRFMGVSPYNGHYQVADSHGNPTSSPDAGSATELVNPVPSYNGGFQNSLTYKGFQLDFFFQFREQAEGYNYFQGLPIPGTFGGGTTGYGGNQPLEVMDRWQQPGDVKPVQRFSQNLSTYQAWLNAQGSNQVYSDASYIRLKNVSLSWQFPKSWLNSMHVQNARLFIHVQNPITITSYKGLDPETGSGSLPVLKVYTGGIQIGI